MNNGHVEKKSTLIDHKHHDVIRASTEVSTWEGLRSHALFVFGQSMQYLFLVYLVFKASLLHQSGLNTCLKHELILIQTDLKRGELSHFSFTLVLFGAKPTAFPPPVFFLCHSYNRLLFQKLNTGCMFVPATVSFLGRLYEDTEPKCYPQSFYIKEQ